MRTNINAPEINYMRSLDHWFNGCVIFILYTLVELIIVKNSIKLLNKKAKRIMDVEIAINATDQVELMIKLIKN